MFVWVSCVFTQVYTPYKLQGEISLEIRLEALMENNKNDQNSESIDTISCIPTPVKSTVENNTSR